MSIWPRAWRFILIWIIYELEFNYIFIFNNLFVPKLVEYPIFNLWHEWSRIEGNEITFIIYVNELYFNHNFFEK
jgi:hypothetical protein